MVSRSRTPAEQTLAELLGGIDNGWEGVQHPGQEGGYDLQNMEHLQTLYLESIAYSLSAIARLMLRRDEEALNEWYDWF